MLVVFGSSLVREKSALEGIRGPILRNNIFQKHIFGSDLLQFYEGYFYYKYRLCIRVNLETEGLKQRFRKATTKLGFV